MKDYTSLINAFLCFVLVLLLEDIKMLRVFLLILGLILIIEFNFFGKNNRGKGE